ncbi:MAG TPA: preprotein translocase subunit SecY [Gemmataceae bacterium]|nr:preprotein translocase subunit SecY [Gemmataceae bacterium]
MNKLIAIFKIPELRQKIFITLLFLAIYRIGYYVPLPFIDQTRMEEAMRGAQRGALGQALGLVSMFSGGTLSQAVIFTWGVMPYISASIIFQLLASVYPPLEKLQKEGESGRKKINEYTRYATVPICLIQSFFLVQYLMRESPTTLGLGLPEWRGYEWFTWSSMILTMTAGTIFLMWLGEQIDEYGIGNGISLIIMAGIVARIPDATGRLLIDPQTGWFKESIFTLGGGSGQDISFEKLVVLVMLFVGVVVAVIAITKGQRRIPTQSAKHVRGRRVFGGTRQYLPLRVNQAGVMPVIFASSLLMLPYFLLNALAHTGWGWVEVLRGSFERQGYIYNLFYIALIYFFCYFWTAIIFNPKDMANNLKEYGSFIPGYRPGKRTAEYLERVMMRITYVGAAFLAVVAVIPSLMSAVLGVDYVVASFYGGTGLLIVISVALDLVQKINSHLVMRNYPALTED